MSQRASTASLAFSHSLSKLAFVGGMTMFAATAVTLDQEKFEAHPLRTAFLLASYSYLGYRSLKDLRTCSTYMAAPKQQTELADYTHTAKLDWNTSRFLFATAVDFATAIPTAQYGKAAFSASIGAGMLLSVYVSQKHAKDLKAAAPQND